MGVCSGVPCCKDGELILTNEFNPPVTPKKNINIYNGAENGCDIETNNYDYSLRTKYKNMSYNINDEENIKMEEEIFNYINEIKMNPDDFKNESKNHYLFEIFMKLKPSDPFKKTEFNLNSIKTYLFMNIIQDKAVSMQEKELLEIFPENSIKNISLFQKMTAEDDNKENVWQFLEENEDDIEKILMNFYEYLIVICQPTENKAKTVISFIFYNI